MITPIIAFLSRQDRRLVIAVGIALTFLLGITDYVTGFEISFSIFYLAPISIVTWLTGRKWGVTLACISALVWLGADVVSGHLYTHPFIPFWNALTRLGFFLVVVSSLSQLRRSYREKIQTARKLQESLDNVKVLSGLIPICAWCKKVRNDKGYWQQVEAYISEHSDASFTHGICQACQEKEFRSIPQRETL